MVISIFSFHMLSWSAFRGTLDTEVDLSTPDLFLLSHSLTFRRQNLHIEFIQIIDAIQISVHHHHRM